MAHGIHVPPWLILSKSFLVQRLVGDIPFIATGLAAIPVGFLLLAKKRINVMTSMILLSAYLSLIAVIVDIGILIQLSNAASSNSSTLTDVGSFVTSQVIREMFLASAVTLRFLFFWHFVALPGPGETKTVITRYSSSFIPDLGTSNSGSWTQWGIIGVILKYFMLTAVVAVGVFQSLWRLERLFGLEDNGTTIGAASASLEIALSALFILKLLGNLLFTKGRRSRMFLSQLPILFAMALSVGVGAGGVAVEVFMEYPLGRLLQALEIYILTIYILFLGFDDIDEPGTSRSATQEEKSRLERRVSAAESFSAVQGPTEDGFIFVSRNPANDATPTVPRRPSMGIRPLSAERVVDWVSRRLSGRPPELPNGVGTSARAALSMIKDNKDEKESTVRSESIYSYYSPEDLQRMSGVVAQSVQAPRRSEMFTVPPTAPPVPGLNLSKFQGQIPRESGAASPIYGINGPIVDKRDRRRSVASSKKPRRPSVDKTPPISAPVIVQPVVDTGMSTISEEPSQKTTSAENIVRAIEEFSSSSLQLPDPVIGENRATLMSDLSSPRSGGSGFSLTRFPLPPALPSGMTERAMDDAASIDAEFEFIPPRKLEPRLQSFPATMRGSVVSTLPDEGASRASKMLLDAYRYPGREITSFIGGVSKEDKEMNDARAISRILKEPISIPSSPAFTPSRPPPSTSYVRKTTRLSEEPNSRSTPSTGNAIARPTINIPNSLPSNPRPSSNTSPNLSPSFSKNSPTASRSSPRMTLTNVI